MTDRTGEKGDRDLLVALGLLMTAGRAELDELDGAHRRLRAEHRHAVRSNLTLLSLLEARASRGYFVTEARPPVPCASAFIAIPGTRSSAASSLGGPVGFGLNVAAEAETLPTAEMAGMPPAPPGRYRARA